MSLKPITLKRINRDIKMFFDDEHEYISIYPNPNNILEIYFILKGQKDTIYENGEYLCKLLHSKDYPLKAPDYFVFTPNGRFETDKKICLSNSAFHQKDWAPGAWNLLSLLNGFFSIWHSDIREDRLGISHVQNINESNVKNYAKESKDWNKNSQFYNNYKIEKST